MSLSSPIWVMTTLKELWNCHKLFQCFYYSSWFAQSSYPGRQYHYHIFPRSTEMTEDGGSTLLRNVKCMASCVEDNNNLRCILESWQIFTKLLVIRVKVFMVFLSLIEHSKPPSNYIFVHRLWSFFHLIHPLQLKQRCLITWTRWYANNSPDFNSGGARLESQPGHLAFLNDVLRGFPGSRHANAEIRRLSYDRFVPNSFQFICRPAIRSYVAF